MRNYAEALAKYESTKPIRGKGRYGGVVPLGHRDRAFHQMRKTESGVIHCGYPEVNIVSFYPDGTITINDTGWSSISVAALIQEIIYVSAYIYDRSLIVSAQGKQYRVGNKGLTLQLNAEGYPIVTGAQKSYTYTINRKKMKELRKATQPFRTYLTGTTKLRQGVFAIDEVELPDNVHDDWNLCVVSRWNRAKPQTLEKFLPVVMQQEDAGNWHKASVQLAFAGYYWKGEVRTSVTDMLERLDTALLAANPDVFDKHEVPEGTVKRNRYGKFNIYKEAL